MKDDVRDAIQKQQLDAAVEQDRRSAEDTSPRLSQGDGIIKIQKVARGNAVRQRQSIYSRVSAATSVQRRQTLYSPRPPPLLIALPESK